MKAILYEIFALIANIFYKLLESVKAQYVRIIGKNIHIQRRESELRKTIYISQTSMAFKVLEPIRKSHLRKME